MFKKFLFDKVQPLELITNRTLIDPSSTTVYSKVYP